MDIYQACLEISSHGSIWTGIKTWGLHAMSALEGKFFPLYVNPWNRLGLFIDGLE
jgi:hypothetical protein